MTVIAAVDSQPITQSGRGSEDCLFLNIYVPNFKKNGNKHGGAMPVMFWIHGGGLTAGAGSDYDPTPLLAPQNVIVVTINYRLLPEAISSTPHTSATFRVGAIDGAGTNFSAAVTIVQPEQ